jgi:hypothetical protein
METHDIIEVGIGGTRPNMFIISMGKKRILQIEKNIIVEMIDSEYGPYHNFLEVEFNKIVNDEEKQKIFFRFLKKCSENVKVIYDDITTLENLRRRLVPLSLSTSSRPLEVENLLDKLVIKEYLDKPAEDYQPFTPRRLKEEKEEEDQNHIVPEETWTSMITGGLKRCLNCRRSKSDFKTKRSKNKKIVKKTPKKKVKKTPKKTKKSKSKRQDKSF